jgi:hypothetical protein
VTTTATTEPVTAFSAVSLTGSKAATSALRPFSFAAPPPGIKQISQFYPGIPAEEASRTRPPDLCAALMHRPDMQHRCLILIGLSASTLDRSGEVAMRDRVGRL